MSSTLFKISWKIIKWTEANLQYYWNIFQRACILQHASSMSSTYPGSCKTCFFRIPVFGGKVFLIFPIIYLTVDLKLICIIGLSDLINSLIFANSCPGWHNYSAWGFFSQLALKFHWVKMCFGIFGIFDIFNITNCTLKLLICHAQTSLFVNCAGGSQGVQLLDGLNKDQVWAIRLRWVWGSWHPSI